MAMTRTRGAARQGMTLVEATFSVLLVSVMMVAVLSMFGGIARSRQVSAGQQLGPVLARHLESEVLQAQYQSPTYPILWGPEPGENNGTRTAFNDVDDYDGWSETTPQDKNGSPLPNAAGWTRAVRVEYVDPANANGSAIGTDLGLKRITVTVTAPGGGRTVLVGLRSKYTDQPSATQVQRLTWVNIGLQIGPDAAARRTAAAAVLNTIQVSP
jgi:type II secretory pathway pseudopilin PulG